MPAGCACGLVAARAGLTLTMYMLSSPASRASISSRAGTGVRCAVMSTTGVPLRQLLSGTLVGTSWV